MWLLAPENDYEAVRRVPDPLPARRVAVCMPVYNRVDLLARTVAALAAQSYPRHLLEVRIGDDGSEEDVEAAISSFRDQLNISVHRRERDGYGAGQARNLAAAHADAEILVFIDADCLPDRDLVLRHALWHHKAENLVVIGSRHGLDTSAFTLDTLASGTAPLRQAAFGTDLPADRDVSPSDHRGVLHRRTAQQRRSDEAFRSLVSSNFSIRSDRFREVGGFDETFHRWGGEDVELGWRCQNLGFYIVPDDHAVTFHQLQEDLWETEGREASRALNDGVIQNKIPHSFYRKPVYDPVWQVPKLSVVTLPVVPERLQELSEQLRRQTFRDWEFVVHGNGPEIDMFGELNIADPRIQVVVGDDPLDAFHATRGEYVAIVHGDAALEPRLFARLVRRMERQRRASAARCGYLVDTTPRGGGHRDALDQAWDTASLGLPVFHLARRREWAKAMHGATTVGEAFRTVDELSSTVEIGESLIRLRAAQPNAEVGQPLDAFVAPTTTLRKDLAKAGKRPQALRAAVTFVRDRRYTVDRTKKSPTVPAPIGTTRRPSIRYVGWTGHENLGDEVLLEAITGALEWGDVQTSGAGDLLLLGGGTLINRGSYLHWLAEQDSPRIERAVFGTGVANPDFWGNRDDTSGWVEWLETCVYLGVRGPLSADFLDRWGIRADVEIVGDAALLLEPTAERDDRRIVVAPCRTRGELWGGDDAAVFAETALVVKGLLARDYDVHLLASHPDDDGPCLDIMRQAGRPDLPYHAGYADTDAAASLLASAELVVAERLHAAVIAAAANTPFVAVEYRPKLRDFAQSVGFDEFVVRTDEMPRLSEVVDHALVSATQLRTDLAPRVAEYRSRLTAASDRLRQAMIR